VRRTIGWSGVQRKEGAVSRREVMASPLSGKPGQIRCAILQSLSANNNRRQPASPNARKFRLVTIVTLVGDAPFGLK
jgi:hypothetical protein